MAEMLHRGISRCVKSVEVSSTSDGGEGIQRAQSGQFRLVIVNLGKDAFGLRFVQELRGTDWETSVVITSGWSSAVVPEMRQLIEGGIIQGYLERPYTSDTLKGVVNAALNILPRKQPADKLLGAPQTDKTEAHLRLLLRPGRDEGSELP